METQHSAMKFQILFFLLVLTCMYPSVAPSPSNYENCCLKYAKIKKDIWKNVVSYRKQEADGGCNIPAVVFIMKRMKRIICVDPYLPWVEQMIQKIDKKKAGTA
ncbi:C-C motif chemokine 21-like [Carassius carassius]|uniref:C-C motif chemokine 21-like n=1 Tax=Carassius carassius TaxID=217509 RepID=UPI00286842AF|nr:C-C motif chemokine 21-like [Carassius carassius]